ncbi:hypothetical protein QTO30_10155 [Yoonia sp. GPGPB17]|uniref:hypothetical protein n=1 Tax=Yoonia sp. GPGPB17 TaxID=3026147 RepID=UPI0030BD3B7C
MIGNAAALGDLDRATQLIAHTALGCATGEIGSGDCSSGAIGAFAGELSALLYTDAALNNPELVGDSIADWESRGILIAELSGDSLPQQLAEAQMSVPERQSMQPRTMRSGSRSLFSPRI